MTSQQASSHASSVLEGEMLVDESSPLLRTSVLDAWRLDVYHWMAVNNQKEQTVRMCLKRIDIVGAVVLAKLIALEVAAISVINTRAIGAELVSWPFFSQSVVLTSPSSRPPFQSTAWSDLVPLLGVVGNSDDDFFRGVHVGRVGRYPAASVVSGLRRARPRHDAVAVDG
ncbi:hypothetical protein SEUCBS140593_000912 [Sporothrix eucalyptigena]|uniref:Uncharacterized protein n=1 Tax=Sporothrix eucalyptigena TaxID=1812306 RepID=A0ABP0AU50_9PEZI